MGKGYLKVELRVGDNLFPVPGAKVLIKDASGKTLFTLVTDENGITPKIALDAPDRSLSMKPFASGPIFSVCDVEVPAYKGYKHEIIHGVQIFDGETSILPVLMIPDTPGTPELIEIFIPEEHGVDLNHEYQGMQSGESVESKEAMAVEPMAAQLANDVTIPQYITVHLGTPNSMAQNVRVTFKDYIKNVASSEIFPTWHTEALHANIYAQISLVLNRVFTHWYPTRSKDFDITNSTAFDQYFVYGRNIFENISRIVDEIFNMFTRRVGRKEPFFAEYCNGTTVTCPGMSQWGSQDLAARGYKAIDILRYYYPDDLQIVESTNFGGTVFGTFPGAVLREGSRGDDVLLMQRYLNRIGGDFPAIPPIRHPDGIFGAMTKNAVMAFQPMANLTADGVIGKQTWYAITQYFVAVARLAELTSEGFRIGIDKNPPTTTISMGSRGELVIELQFLLNYISQFYPTLPAVVQNGVFQDDTKRGVVDFQGTFGLTPDGVVGPATWSRLYQVYWSIVGTVPEVPDAGLPSNAPPFPGTSLRVGSTGENVRIMQAYLNAIGGVYTSIPYLTADGVFGAKTESAVKEFQRLFGLTQDGVIGQMTWNKIVSVFYSLSGGEYPVYPGTALRVGSRGNDVTIVQKFLNSIGRQYTSIPALTADGVFGSGTERAVKEFQRLFGLAQDGVVGRQTWDKLVSVYNSLGSASTAAAPEKTVAGGINPMMAMLIMTMFKGM